MTFGFLIKNSSNSELNCESCCSEALMEMGCQGLFFKLNLNEVCYFFAMILPVFLLVHLQHTTSCVRLKNVRDNFINGGSSGSSIGASTVPGLPVTHRAFYEVYKDDMVNLGPNIEGAKDDFVVPAYTDINFIEDLEEK